MSYVGSLIHVVKEINDPVAAPKNLKPKPTSGLNVFGQIHFAIISESVRALHTSATELFTSAIDFPLSLYDKTSSLKRLPLQTSQGTILFKFFFKRRQLFGFHFYGNKKS